MAKYLTLEETVAKLEVKGYVVKKSGGTYRSQCPAHDGKDLNLAFTEGKNGQVVFTCHSHQCSYEEIMQALGVEKDVIPQPLKKSAYGKTLHPTFEKAVSAAAFGVGVTRKPDAVYRYDNIDGSENLFLLRWDEEQGKQNRPVTKIGDGYICGTKTDDAYPIYRLPQIAEALKTQNRIYICEGEKATDAAVSIGLPATTSAFGSNNATKTNWLVLDKLALEHNRKLEIVILPDNDKPGLQYADTLVEIFTKFKSKPVVKIVSLADFGHVTGIEPFPEGGDFYDLCEILDAKSDDEIRNMIEKMLLETLLETEIVEEEANTVYPWHPFPVDLLPETVSRFVKEVSVANGCDPAGPAIAALVALATAIGNSRRLRLKRGWVFPAILWGMLIARKGSIKSWALAPSIKPLDNRQQEYQEQYERDKAEYDRKKAEYMLLSPKQRREAAPFTEKEPIKKRIVSRDTTDQKMVKNCAENPRGFCIFSDELSTLLLGMGQYCKDAKGGNAQSIFNSLFNGEGLESERISESRCAPQAFVCIIGGIQPSIARQCFDKQAFESGFASRFMPVAPPPRIARWSDGTVTEETEQSYAQLIYAILTLTMEAVYGSTANLEVSQWNPDGNAMIAMSGVTTEPTSYRPILIDTSPEALEIYKEFYDRTADEMLALEDDNIRGTFEKLRTYAARLALVVHVTRFVEQELFLKQNIDTSVAPWDRSTPRIDELECDTESMLIAVALANWFKYEVRRVYATWGGLTDETPVAKVNGLQQRLVEFMEQKRDPVSLSDLKRRFRAEKENVPKSVDGLVVQGILERIEPVKKGPGRKSELLRLAKMC